MSINYQRKLVAGNQRGKAIYIGVLNFNSTYNIQLNNSLLKPRHIRQAEIVVSDMESAVTPIPLISFQYKRNSLECQTK